MKDKKLSEEELYDELDVMYRRVADLERMEAAPEGLSGLQEYKQTADKPASTHEKIIPLLYHEIRAILGKPFKKKLRQNEKWSYRRMIVITMSVPLILLASILIMTIVKVTITSQNRNSDHIQSSTRATSPESKEHPSALPSVQTEQKARKKLRQLKRKQHRCLKELSNLITL